VKGAHDASKIYNIDETGLTVVHRPLSTNNHQQSNKAYGFDDVSPRVLKMVINCISHPLADIVNLSFNEGLFPDMLKLAKVVPLHKGGDNTILSNYRPVSVLSIFSKVFERLLYNRLNNYLISNKLLCDCQFGFRKQHTTSMAILQLVDKIASECDCGNITIGVFLDLSKALTLLIIIFYWINCLCMVLEVIVCIGLQVI